MTATELRELAGKIIEARRLLLAGVVAYHREDSNLYWYLEQSFTRLVESMPLPLQFERYLTARIKVPADRMLDRRGVLSIAEDVDGWAL